MRIKDECSIIVPRKDLRNNVTTTDGKGMKGNNVKTCTIQDLSNFPNSTQINYCELNFLVAVVCF